MNESAQAHKPSAKERLWEELIKYGYLSAYLWVCFSALHFYQSSTAAEPNSSLHYGTALIKALLIGKFILIGDAIKVGANARGPTLLHRVAWKSIAFLVILIVFTIFEEIIVGWFHDRTVVESIKELLSRPWPAIVSPTILMWLILIPMVTTIEIQKAMGARAFNDMMFGRD